LTGPSTPAFSVTPGARNRGITPGAGAALGGLAAAADEVWKVRDGGTA
jgi:hypothetical protein